MIRNEKLEDISDGRLYDANDMVKAYCNECKGCHACCTGMGNSIVLDPMDVMRLCRETGKNFTQLLEKELEVNVVDGLVLPNIKMTADIHGHLDAKRKQGIAANMQRPLPAG